MRMSDTRMSMYAKSQNRTIRANPPVYPVRCVLLFLGNFNIGVGSTPLQMVILQMAEFIP